MDREITMANQIPLLFILLFFHFLSSIMDIVDNGGYYIAESGEITGDVIDAFVRGYLNKEIERKQMVA